MRLVNFLTFVFKVFYFCYLVFILLPFAIIGTSLIMFLAFLEWIVKISIIQNVKKYSSHNRIVSNS
jgi:hypothetical protein